MAVVARLLTFVDLVDGHDDGPDASTISVSARHEAVLADGRRILLLDDRGWSESMRTSWDHEPSEHERDLARRAGIWQYETAEGMERTARVVVGPDEPFGDHTWADMEAGHWATLAGVLHRHGVEIDAPSLRALPHDVELSERVRARIGPARAEPGE